MAPAHRRFQASACAGSALPGDRLRPYNLAMTSAITVVVADDHPLYRAGLVDAIAERADLELLAECSGGAAAVEQIRARRPDVALLDLRMRDLDGMAVLEAITGDGGRTRVVFLSAHEEGEVVHRAMSAGAAGYLTKETDRDEICDAILRAAAGGLVLSADLSGVVVAYMHQQRQNALPNLAPREREVLRLTAEGLSAPAIAGALDIGVNTVKTHLKRIYRKLDVGDRAGMVAKALRLGLLT
jgi:two-component system, NarL family, nitrate/nitrite response regulator NarL